MNHTIIAAAFVLGASCAALATEIARPPGTTTEILRTDRTATGQPIEVPAHPDIVVSLTVIPVHGATRVHKHPYQRYVYVLAGRLRVTDMTTGDPASSSEAAGQQRSRDYKAGDFLAEMRGTYHFGANMGDEPVKLLVIDQVPQGTKTNVVMQTDEQ